MAELKLFFDGGCRPNPGPIEVAVVTRGQTFFRADVGTGSNSDAEWLALLYALEIAHELGGTDILLVGDSAMVVSRASGTVRPRSRGSMQHLTAFQAKAAKFRRVRLRHVGRSRNLAGIALDAAHHAV